MLTGPEYLPDAQLACVRCDRYPEHDSAIVGKEVDLDGFAVFAS